MNIICKLYFVELTSEIYKTSLFIFMNLITDTYKLDLPNMNIILRKAIWYYTINITVSQLILQNSNTGSGNWFLYLQQHIQKIIVLHSTTQGIQKVGKKGYRIQYSNKAKTQLLWVYIPPTITYWYIQTSQHFPLHILSYFLYYVFCFYFETLEYTCNV